MRFAALIALSLAACTQAPAPPATPLGATSEPQTLEGAQLNAEGLGPIRIGMRESDLRAMFGEPLNQGEINPDAPTCREWSILMTPTGNGVGILSIDGEIERLSIGGDVAIRTPEGIGFGSTAAEVRAAYPDAEREGAEYVPAPGHELFVWRDRENHTGLRFEIGDDERVTDIHAGRSLRSMGGCF
jgi:hypothetical protein